MACWVDKRSAPAAAPRKQTCRRLVARCARTCGSFAITHCHGSRTPPRPSPLAARSPAALFLLYPCGALARKKSSAYRSCCTYAMPRTAVLHISGLLYAVTRARCGIAHMAYLSSHIARHLVYRAAHCGAARLRKWLRRSRAAAPAHNQTYKTQLSRSSAHARLHRLRSGARCGTCAYICAPSSQQARGRLTAHHWAHQRASMRARA